jgi:hypothetical protein
MGPLNVGRIMYRRNIYMEREFSSLAVYLFLLSCLLCKSLKSVVSVLAAERHVEVLDGVKTVAVSSPALRTIYEDDRALTFF